MSQAAEANEGPLIVGRYALFDALAAGGMATVHLGRLLGAEGFGRTVAVKRLHAHFTSDPEFTTMFMDEARIVSRIRHPNVVAMVDVVESRKGLFLVMDYVHGESFSRLLRTCRAQGAHAPLKVVCSIMQGVLLGLHAAHDTKGPNGELLDVVHRDVSPQNIIVGSDGIARVLDFGVAKAVGRAQVTHNGQLKGKLTYMAPEQIRGRVDRRADVFAAAIILWEALAGRRIHDSIADADVVARIMLGGFEAPSVFRPEIAPALDAIVMRGLELEKEKRYQSAREMARDLERVVGLSNPSEVGEWVESLAGEALHKHSKMVAAMEAVAATLSPVESNPPPANSPSTEPPPEDTERLSAPHLGADQSPSQPGTSSVHLVAPAPTQPQKPARDLTPWILIGTFFAVLALVGATLEGIAIRARNKAKSTPASSAGQSATATASSSGGASTAPDSSTNTTSAASSTRTADAGASRGGPKAGRLPTQDRRGEPARSAPAPIAPPPAARGEGKNCDPPYTVDENGHRKYKMECMGLE